MKKKVKQKQTTAMKKMRGWSGKTCFACRKTHKVCSGNGSNKKDGYPCQRCIKMNIECVLPMCTNCWCELFNLECNGEKPCSTCIKTNQIETCVYKNNSKKRKRSTSTFLHSKLIPKLDGCQVTAIEMHRDLVIFGMYTKDFKDKYKLSNGKQWTITVEKIIQTTLNDPKNNDFTDAMAEALREAIHSTQRLLKRRKKNEKYIVTAMLLSDDITRLQEGFKHTGEQIATQDWIKGVYKSDADILKQLTSLRDRISAQDQVHFEKQCHLSQSIVLASIDMIYNIYNLKND